MNFAGKFFESMSKTLLSRESLLLNQIRGKKKKATTSSRNTPKHPRPKHRGWKVQDGCYVSAGTIVVTQRTLIFHPGLNVGLGQKHTLYALEHGRVVVTCEEINPNWDHTLIQRTYAGRENQTIYKKHFNILPITQHNRFKLIDEI